MYAGCAVFKRQIAARMLKSEQRLKVGEWRRNQHPAEGESQHVGGRSSVSRRANLFNSIILRAVIGDVRGATVC